MVWSLALVMSLLAQTPGVEPSVAADPTATTTPAPEAAPAAPRTLPLLLVLDVGGDHVPKAERDGLTEAFTLALARRLDLEVQSPRSLMDRVNFAEQQQQAGCESSACMAEIANAMGARFVVFSRVVQLGDEQVLRADVYDNGVGRSVALAAVQAGTVSDLGRRLPGLVEDLIREAHGDLPLRAVERPIAVSGDAPMSATAKNGLILGGIGLGATVVGGGLFAAGAIQLTGIGRAANAYAAEPSIDNARAVIDARGPFDDTTLTFGSCASGCVGVGGLVALLVGIGVFALDATAPAAEPTP